MSPSAGPSAAPFVIRWLNLRLVHHRQRGPSDGVVKGAANEEVDSLANRASDSLLTVQAWHFCLKPTSRLTFYSFLLIKILFCKLLLILHHCLHASSHASNSRHGTLYLFLTVYLAFFTPSFFSHDTGVIASGGTVVRTSYFGVAVPPSRKGTAVQVPYRTSYR